MRWLILQIGFWTGAYLIINLSPWTIGVFTAGENAYWLASLYGSVFNLLIFYSHANYFLPRLLKDKKWPNYLLAIVLLLLVGSTLESSIDLLFLHYHPSFYSLDFQELFWNNLAIHGLFFLFPSYLFRFGQDWFVHERREQVLKAEKLSAELSFLKAQINPHFLFNTLNNLFASAHQSQDQQTASGIAKLAHMMRYMLEESEAEKVALSDELSQLEHYIDLQSLRFSSTDAIDIRFEYSGNMEALQIPPLLLIPFVENAYKHGIRLESPSFIKINLEATQERLFFRVKNSLHPTKTPSIGSEGGIGLQNVRKRLALLFPEKHQLQITQNRDFYDVQLNFEL